MSFIKIDRDILNSYCFANANHLKIWLWLLVKANYKVAYVSFKIGKGCTTIKIDRGQLVFGRFKAEEELGLDGSLIYRALLRFEELNQIKIESNNQYSIITICKYDDYQGNDNDDEQLINNQRPTNDQPTSEIRTTDEQQVNTSKEELEYKEERIKEYKGEIKNLFLNNDVIEYWKEWIEYKSKEFKFKYKTIQSEQAAFNQLVDLSDKNSELAIKILKQSMANGWKGLFELKISQNKTLSSQNGNTYQNQVEIARKAFKPLPQ